MNFIDPKNPLKIATGGTHLANLFLQVRINGDVALLKSNHADTFGGRRKKSWECF